MTIQITLKECKVGPATPIGLPTPTPSAEKTFNITKPSDLGGVVDEFFCEFLHKVPETDRADQDEYIIDMTNEDTVEQTTSGSISVTVNGKKSNGNGLTYSRWALDSNHIMERKKNKKEIEDLEELITTELQNKEQSTRSDKTSGESLLSNIQPNLSSNK